MKVITDDCFRLGDYEVATLKVFLKIYAFKSGFIDSHFHQWKITNTCFDPLDLASMSCLFELKMKS